MADIAETLKAVEIRQNSHDETLRYHGAMLERLSGVTVNLATTMQALADNTRRVDELSSNLQRLEVRLDDARMYVWKALGGFAVVSIIAAPLVAHFITR
jgi:uncharacterized protein Yka (UPF0111/DUF47 family)